MAAHGFDVAVIGAGIVGLATARAILLQDSSLRLVVLEKESGPAQHQSGHNSGVLHTGIYYTPGSLKAQLCVRGHAAMVEYCRTHDVQARLCGKLIIASQEDQLENLHELHRRATANGVPNLELIDGSRIAEFEPHARGAGALVVPGAGIVDYAAVCAALVEDIASMGGSVRWNTKVTPRGREAGATVLRTTQGDVHARFVVNCGGLHCDRVAHALGADTTVRIIPFRGEYLGLKSPSRELVRGLVYPVPDPRFPFLGVHFTPKLDGGVEVGPNALLSAAREGYRAGSWNWRDVRDTLTFGGFWRMSARNWRMGVAEWRRSLQKELLVRDLQALVPQVRGEDVVPAGAGVRAQAVAADGSLLDDFHLVEDEGALHVLNAPSPAATASLAIADELAAKTMARLGHVAG